MNKKTKSQNKDIKQKKEIKTNQKNERTNRKINKKDWLVKETKFKKH